MRVVNVALPAAAVGTLVTGVLLSLGTKWGLLRHYWVATKLTLSVGVIVTEIALVDRLIQQSATAAPAQAVDAEAILGIASAPTTLLRCGSVGAGRCNRRTEGSSERFGEIHGRTMQCWKGRARDLPGHANWRAPQVCQARTKPMRKIDIHSSGRIVTEWLEGDRVCVLLSPRGSKTEPRRSASSVPTTGLDRSVPPTARVQRVAVSSSDV